MKQVQMGGQTFNVRDLDFSVEKEHINEYALLDGGKVLVRVPVTRIFQAVDDQGKPLRHPNGDPFIIVENGALMAHYRE